ncbi:MAG: hypothetical protein VYE18_09595 [Pseudomonadota bacterium]|nr:hypothetical protein [Pseudomonadota bacterium]
MGALKGSGSDSVENGRADHHHLTEPPHKVCSLLATLNISKLEVNRARNKLSTLKFELRKEYHIDRCSVLVQCTVKGPNFLSEYGKIVAKSGLPIEPAAAS